jgi:2-dehydro-3-deoxygluconokinase
MTDLFLSPPPRRVALIGECMIEMQRDDAAINQSFGGDTLNTAVYLARLCPRSMASVDYVTALGQDPFSEAMLQAWQAEGVGTERVRQISNALPGLYFIQTDAYGERQFLYWRGEAAARFCFDGPEADATLAALEAYDVIYLSGISLAVLTDSGRQRLLDTLTKARSHGARIIFDNNYRPRLWPSREDAQGHYRALLSQVDLALITWEDDADLFGFTNTETLFAAYEALGVTEVVLKRGDSPCLIHTDKMVLTVTGEKAPCVVDTTAAGDSFSAAYLACRLQGGEPEQAARWGHRLAVHVIQHRGALIPASAMPAMPGISYSLAAQA